MATQKTGNKGSRNRIKNIISLLVTLSLFMYMILLVGAVPDGVSVTNIANLTSAASTGTNYTQATSGGYIYITNLTADQQNSRWKAFVGNVSGKLTLDDASGFAIYDWELTSISGEVYITRTASTVDWSSITCATYNVTQIENILVNHTDNPGDNITATFINSSVASHAGFNVGAVTVAADTCEFVATIYENNTGDPVDEDFQQVMLYDSSTAAVTADTTFGNVVYAQILEEDNFGYDNSSTYDFQLLVPDNGNESISTPIPYYFYVELS